MPALPRPPDRGGGRQAPSGHVGPGERVRPRRHPDDHRPGRPSGGRHGERRRAVDPEVLGDGRAGRGARHGGRRCARHRCRRRGRGGGRGRPDRQARAGDHDAGGGRSSVGRAHRADGDRRPCAVPRGRRAARGHALSQEHPGRADQPPQGHGRPEHRREAHPAGRARLAAGQQSQPGPAAGHAAHRPRREDRDQDPGQDQLPCSGSRSSASSRRRSRATSVRSASRTARSS